MMNSGQISLRYYQSDVAPEIGDRVRYINRENEEHVVVEVIDTASKMKAFGQAWAGILIKDTRYGLVAEDMSDPELEFISRGKK